MNKGLFARFLDVAPDAMLVVGGDGKIVLANRLAERMFGYRRGQLIGEPVERLVPMGSKMSHRKHLAGFFGTPKTRPMGSNLGLRGLTRNGDEFPIEISLGPIKTDDGNLVLAAIRDIAEKRRTEAETLAAKDKAAAAGNQLKSAIKSITEGFVLYDAEGRLVLCNKTFRSFYKYRRADTKPGVATYDSLGRIDEERDDSKRKRTTIQQSLDKLRAEGVIHDIVTVGERIIQRRQEITAEGGLISVHSDITDRMRAEDDLQGRIKFSNLLQRITIAANQATSVEGVLQFCIDEVCAVTGWPVGHVYLVADDDSGDVISTSLWCLDVANPTAWIKRFNDEARFTPGKGLTGQVLAKSRPVWIADVTKEPTFERMKLAGTTGIKAGFAFPVLTGSKVAAIVEFFSHEAVAPDSHMLEVMEQIGTQLGRVIERRAAEDALKQSEQRFRFVMDNSPAAVNLKDAEGRYLLVNARFEEWYGLAARDVIGKTVGEVFPELKMAPFAALEREVLRLKSPSEREFEIDFADGKKHLVLGSKFIVDDSKGRPMGIGTIEIDVTEPRRTETQLRQAQKMEAVGQLTGGVAHDFNNLLAVISGNLELLDEALEGDDVKRELLGWAIAAADDAATLTQRLLAFSRQQPLSPRTVLINELVMNLIVMLRRPLGEIVDIETVLSDGLWLTTVDPAQFENAVLNLVLNARDAMPEGGVVTITTENVTLKKADVRRNADVTPGEYIKLSVGDTGHGLTRESLAHAFEPFYTTKEVGQGSGLGLSMVYGFSKQSGGHAEIESNGGQGTVASFYLPRASKCKAVSPEPRDLATPPGGGETIFIVEDEDSVRDLAVRIISDLGYEVLQARDALEAFDVLDSDTHIDLLFTDLVLPGRLSGQDLATRALAKRPALAVIYVSGYSAAIEADSPIEEGAVRLAKPYRKAELAKALRQALGD